MIIWCYIYTNIHIYIYHKTLVPQPFWPWLHPSWLPAALWPAAVPRLGLGKHHRLGMFFYHESGDWGMSHVLAFPNYSSANDANPLRLSTKMARLKLELRAITSSESWEISMAAVRGMFPWHLLTNTQRTKQNWLGNRPIGQNWNKWSWELERRKNASKIHVLVEFSRFRVVFGHAVGPSWRAKGLDPNGVVSRTRSLASFCLGVQSTSFIMGWHHLPGTKLNGGNGGTGWLFIVSLDHSPIPIHSPRLAPVSHESVVLHSATLRHLTLSRLSW